MIYNTFVVQNCKTNKTVLVTSSARKAAAELVTGQCVEVWNDNKRMARLTFKQAKSMQPFIRAEKDYIRQKQTKAEQKHNKRGSGSW